MVCVITVTQLSCIYTLYGLIDQVELTLILQAKLLLWSGTYAPTFKLAGSKKVNTHHLSDFLMRVWCSARQKHCIYNAGHSFGALFPILDALR